MTATALKQDKITSTLGQVPIGGFVGWHKDFSNTPSLPDGWLECDGQVVSDSESVYDGQTLPNLNGEGASLDDERLLMGKTSSGATGGELNHLHTFTGTEVSTSTQVPQGANNVASGANIQGVHTHTLTAEGIVANTTTSPPWFGVVWIIRIK